MLARISRRVIPSSLLVLKAAAIQSQQCCKYHVRHIVPFCKMETSRLYSSVNPEELIVDYEYTKKATSNSNILIVDVREPDEIKEHGKIPNSINIPLGNVASAFGLPEKQFQETYKISKPSENTEIIFYCMIGKRSGKAQKDVLNLGFKNAKNYLGSWTDWANKLNQ